jgi:hypothetical protein
MAPAADWLQFEDGHGTPAPWPLIPAFQAHEDLQNEWGRIVSRGGRAEPRLTGIEDQLTALRREMRDHGVNVLPALIPDLEFLGQSGEPTYCTGHVIGDGHRHVP